MLLILGPYQKGPPLVRRELSSSFVSSEDAPHILPSKLILVKIETGSSKAQEVRARIQNAIDAYSITPRGTYRHQRIDPNYEIRILRIQHGKGDEPLVCMLFPSALKLWHNQKSHSKLKTFRYTALSYWWGEPTGPVDNEITIYKDTGARGITQEFNNFFNKSGTFFIRDNLKAALLRFRHPTEDKNVWVDAICINQDDKTEKTAQVARMHEVYTQAESVCVWLGKHLHLAHPDDDTVEAHLLTS